MIGFEFSGDIPPMAHYHRDAVQQIAACVEERVFCALLGPRLSGKTLILHYIEETLSRQLGWNTIFLDLTDIRATTQQAFFSDLIRQTAEKLAVTVDLEVVLPEGPAASSAVFRGFLQEHVARLGGDLVLVIDPLEALPIDLVQALLTSLRAAYMDQQGEENHLIVIVSGALSLAELTVGESSPFRGIARRIFIGDLNENQSRELFCAFLNRLKIGATRPAVDRMMAAAQGDVYLLRRLVIHGSELVGERVDARLRARDVRLLVRRFLREDVWAYAPLQEAVRLIEENPDLIRCIQALLEEDVVPRAVLPLPLSPDLDPLYLTGVVEKVGADGYRLQNAIYREFLVGHFSPERVGHLLTLAGRWDMALDYLEDRVQRGGASLRADLILATVNSIFASDDLSHAVRYLLRCLSAAFGIQDAQVWHRPARRDYLTLIGHTRSNGSPTQWTDQQIRLDEDRLEARAYRLHASLRGPEIGDSILRAVPLGTAGAPHPIGVLTIGESVRPGDNTAIRERDLELMGFIQQASRALDTVLARRQELAFAGQLQASLLPARLPEVPGWELAATWLPARETSGDFYDFFSLPGERFGVLIADVVDKGMGAALMMALGRTVIRTLITDYPDEPAALLRAANERLRSDLDSGTMITLVYGILDPAEATFTYANAGHPPPRLFYADRRRKPGELRSTGVPLGMFSDSMWLTETVRLPAGSLLLLYTDGVEDTRDERGEFFGTARMIAAVRRTEDGAGVKEVLLNDLAAFRGSMPQYDDVTVVVVAREASLVDPQPP